MKCNIPLSKKKILVSLLCLAGLFILLAGFLFSQNDSRRFREATSKLFRQEMLANTLNMHYTIAHPEDFGIAEYEAILPAYDGSKRQESMQALEKQINFLKALNPDRLSAEENYTRTLLLTHLISSQTLNQFPVIFL